MNKTALLCIGLAGVILIGLFVWLRPAGQPGPPTQAATGLASAAKPRMYAYRIERGQRIAGPAAIRVQRGDSVILKITSDIPDELHLHGYDLHAHVPAGEPITVSFNAAHAGRFDLELHRAQIELATLEVQPR